MPAPILATKLYIPHPRSNLVPRPRLIERLDEGLYLGGKLTLISAPAGFGKTTLLSEWVQVMGKVTPPIAVAWLSLDEGDNDLTRFLTYFVCALQTIAGNLGQGLLTTLQSPEVVNIEPVLTTLLNEIVGLLDNPSTGPERGIVLVLDDYHVIESQPIDQVLAFLLNHLPPQMHLVIASRSDPTLPLPRLRVRGEMTEIRADDLRFTLTEITTFLDKTTGYNLSVENVTALETRTEGWIAGLQLAALSMQTLKQSSDIIDFVNSFTGSHRYVIDYLADEVLERQPEEIKTFLLQTSILNRLSSPLCDAVRFGYTETPGSSFGIGVTGQKNSQAILEALETANLFIVPLDNERRWYRYHHLFADLLRQRLCQTHLDWVSTLHHRASEWYQQNGFIDEAIEHALHAEDFEWAASLIEEYVDVIWQRGEHTKLRQWLVRLPVELVFSKPHLCIIHAWDLFTSGQHNAAERSLQAAEQALDLSTGRATEISPVEGGQPSGSDRMKIRGRVAALRAFLASYGGDVPGTIQYARQALEYLPKQDSNWRSTAAIALGDAYSIRGELAAAYQARLEALEASKAKGNIYMIASLKLADTVRQQGQLRRVLDICQQQWQLAQEIGMSQTVAAGWLLAIWGEVLAELNDLDEATGQATKGVELTERGQDAMVIGWSNLCLIRVLFSNGDIAKIDKIIQKIGNLARKYDMPPFITNPMAAWQARIWLAQDKLTAVSQWVQERGLDAEDDPTLLHEMEYMVLARILIAQGCLDEAARLLQRLLATAGTGGHTARVIELLILQALAFQAGGDTAQAMIPLARALTLAEPGGFIRTFIDEGAPMVQLLSEAATRGIVPDYSAKLLAAFEAEEQRDVDKSSLPTVPSAQPLIEPLSQRELEILQLIAEGLSNREISERLFLALSTVKGHNRNIYGKLEVQRRTEALARARELGLI